MGISPPHPLESESGRVRVKICGLTSVDNARIAAEAGADWIGLNFHPGSPRRIDVETARAILSALPSTTQPVGLFVNRPADEVASVAEWLGLRIVQLHGTESVADLAKLAGLRVVKAFRIGEADDLHAMREYVRLAANSGHPLHAVLVDAFVTGHFGGTGRLVADDLLGPLASMIPDIPRLILAGGLNPENVADRIARVRPWMVDVAGGVESSPGVKDPHRVAAFVRAATTTP